MKKDGWKFGGVKDTLYLCTVKRERPTPDPSRKGGERPPGSGNDQKEEKLKIEN